MIVTIAWIALLAAGLVLEIGSHMGRRPWTSLARMVAGIGRGVPGRLVLVAVWGLVGWHFFSRYTVPH
jgi:hypothetical protein